MAYAGYESELLGAVISLAPSGSPSYLIQAILHGVEPDAPLSQHSAARRGLALDLQQAHDALESHQKTKQPRGGLLKDLCTSAYTAGRVSTQADSTSSFGSRLTAALAPIAAPNAGPAAPQTFHAAVADLHQLLVELPAYLEDLLARAWQAPTLTQQDWGFLEYAADELACAVSVHDRDRSSLEVELTHAIAAGGLTSQAVYGLMFPPLRPFHHACRVLGASTFAQLEKLAPGAQHLTGPSAAKPTWGPAVPLLQKWLARQDDTGEGAVLGIVVDACDRASAARRGRRALTELLDQYMAGHRVVRLSLASGGFTCERGTAKPASDPPMIKSVYVARPLVERWPPGLRETMRMAHLARTADSPMASAALAWSAVEAAGLEPHERSQLAMALSLQALRQQIAQAHTHLERDVRGRHAYWESRQRTNSAAAERVTSILPKLPPNHANSARLVSRIESYMTAAQRSTLELEATESVFKALEGLAAYCPLYEHGAAKDLNSWVDILLPPRAEDSDVLISARIDLSDVLKAASPFPRRQVERWQHRLANATQLADWLEMAAERFGRLLTSMYSARNMTMHSGVFATAGDVVLGTGAVMVTDLMMEFLGNWHRNIPATSTAPDLPAELIKRLADRYAGLVTSLEMTDGPVYRLNVGRITSPSTATAWDR